MSGLRDTCIVNREPSMSCGESGGYFRALGSGPRAHVFVKEGTAKGRTAKYLTDGCWPQRGCSQSKMRFHWWDDKGNTTVGGGGVSSIIRMNFLW